MRARNLKKTVLPPFARHVGAEVDPSARKRLTVIEEPIRTIYEPGNPASHFQPLRDSMRIYFVLLRFSMISLITAIIDNLVFYLVFHSTGAIAGAQIAGRSAAVPAWHGRGRG